MPIVAFGSLDHRPTKFLGFTGGRPGSGIAIRLRISHINAWLARENFGKIFAKMKTYPCFAFWIAVLIQLADSVRSGTFRLDFTISYAMVWCPPVICPICRRPQKRSGRVILERNCGREIAVCSLVVDV